MSLLSAVGVTNVGEQWLDVNGGSYQDCVSTVTVDLWPTIIQQHKFHLDQAGIYDCDYATPAKAHKVVPVTTLGLLVVGWHMPAELP